MGKGSVALSILALLAVACEPVTLPIPAASSFRTAEAPIPSAPSTGAPPSTAPASPTAVPRPPVELGFSSHESHDPGGHRVYLWPRNVGEDVADVRIAGSTLGVPIAGPVVPVTQNWGCVSRVARAATLAVPPVAIRDWRTEATAAKYIVEARIGPHWYAATLVFAGCVSIE